MAGITRVAAARRFGVARVTLERLAAEGRIHPIGRRGRALLYDPAELRRLLPERTSGDGPLTEQVLIRDYRTQVEDLADRIHALHEIWVPVSEAREAWQDFIAAAESETARWPGWLAERAASVGKTEGARLLAAEGGEPRPRPRRLFTAATLREFLADDPSTYPWPPSATRSLEQLAARGLGVEVLDNGPWGPWSEWDPSDGVPRPQPPPMQPLIMSLLPEFEVAAQDEEIFQLLDHVERLPLPDVPSSLAEARAQWREMRSEHRELRVRVRRGHVRRTVLRRQVETALVLFRQSWCDRWWDGLMVSTGCVAGDHGAALTLATSIRTDALADLARMEIGDRVDAPSPRPRTGKK